MKLPAGLRRLKLSRHQPKTEPSTRRIELLFLLAGAVLISAGWVLTYQVVQGLRNNAVHSFQVAELQIVKAVAGSVAACVADDLPGADPTAPAPQAIERCFLSIRFLDNDRMWAVMTAAIMDDVIIDDAPVQPQQAWNGELAPAAFLASLIRTAAGPSPAPTAIQEGFGVYERDAATGAEVVAWAPLVIGDESWIVGMTTPQRIVFEATEVPRQSLLIVFVMAVATLVGLLMLTITIANMRKRQRAEQDLTDANAALESRIAQRTKELVTANEDMRREIERRLEVEKALQSSEGRSRSLLNAIPDLIFVLDRDGNYLEVKGNPNTPYFRASLTRLGSNIRIRGPLAEDLPQVEATIAAALATGATQEVSFRTDDENGFNIWATRLTPINQREVLMLSRNITAHSHALEMIERVNEEVLSAYDATLLGWSRMLEVRENETAGHSLRVADLSVRLARALGCAEAEVVQIRRGALLHDIGKMALPDQILRKAGALTEEERHQVQRHPELAYTWLNGIDFLRPALDIPYCHHERWNGSGYPRGLRGEEIPLAARIFSVVDVWDALLADRPYKARWTPDAAKSYLREHAGELFDQRVVQAFIAIIDEAAP